MAPHHSSPPDPSLPRSPYRFAMPVGAGVLLGAMVLLWVFGPHVLYYGFFNLLSVDPFRFPFVDLHEILAAAECHRQGIDIYIVDPCDVLNRPHAYSPLWLALTPAFLETGDTAWVGLLLMVLFVASLGLAMRPRSAGEVAVFALAIVSPMTIYALERANIDVIMFLLVLGGAALYALPRPYRLGSYALFLLAGLLKFYPLVLLALIGRERGRDIFLPAAVIGSAVLLFAVNDGAGLHQALANLPSPSYFSFTFSALNLPFGLASRMPELPFVPRHVFGALLLAALVALATVRTLHAARHFSDRIDEAGREGAFLVVGSLVITACFFAGRNIDYRGIYFLLVLPGLVRLRRSEDESGTKQFASALIAGVLFVMWSNFFRRAVYDGSNFLPYGGWLLRNVVEPLVWLARELVWWWLITGLAAIVLVHAQRLPLMSDALARLRRLVPAIGT
jgi:hypothetical protein